MNNPNKVQSTLTTVVRPLPPTNVLCGPSVILRHRGTGASFDEDMVRRQTRRLVLLNTKTTSRQMSTSLPYRLPHLCSLSMLACAVQARMALVRTQRDRCLRPPPRTIATKMRTPATYRLAMALRFLWGGPFSTHSHAVHQGLRRSPKPPVCLVATRMGNNIQLCFLYENARQNWNT